MEQLPWIYQYNERTLPHSISQFIDSEMIYVLKHGRVMEHGTHEEVYSLNGAYREIFDAAARSLNMERISGTYNESEKSKF